MTEFNYLPSSSSGDLISFDEIINSESSTSSIINPVITNHDLGLNLANVEPGRIYTADETFYILVGVKPKSSAQRNQRIFAFCKKGLVGINYTTAKVYQGSDILAFIQKRKEIRR